MAIFFSLALSIRLWYNEVNERSDFMGITKAEAIKVAKLLKQYCGEEGIQLVFLLSLVIVCWMIASIVCGTIMYCTIGT